MPAAGERDVDSIDVLDLVRDSGLPAYDCEYVALAKNLGTKPVTKDANLPRAFPGYAMELGNMSAAKEVTGQCGRGRLVAS